MPRRFSTYPRVRTEAAMHVHRKSVGRAPFSTTVLVVENGARGPVGMWETCRRARISVVDRWGVEQQPERKRCEHDRFGRIRRPRR